MKYFFTVFLLLINFSSLGGELRIMSYNVENFFDFSKDKGKNDWTFLPADTRGKRKGCFRIGNPRYRKECLNTDWTLKRYNLKLAGIKRVVSDGGKRPDILAVMEVENRSVISSLAKALNYNSYQITESLDKRGIDVALLYNKSKKLKMISTAHHRLKGKLFKKRPTRDILEVEFLVNNRYKLALFVNHWPSLAGPNKLRLFAARRLKSLIDQQLARGAYVLAIGDFNTIPKAYPNPIYSVLLEGGKIKDVHDQFMKNRKIDRSLKRAMPPGTYFYAKSMQWNMLDRIFASRNLFYGKGIRVDLQSYRIVAPKFATTTYTYQSGDEYFFSSKIASVPWRYDYSSSDVKTSGFSDHFPVAVNLLIKGD